MRVDGLLRRSRCAEVWTCGDAEVAKLFVRGVPRSRIEDEYAVASCAYSAGIPTPRPIGMLEEDGRLGIVFERIQGKDLVAELRDRPDRAVELAAQVAELHSQILEKNFTEIRLGRRSLRVGVQAAPGLSLEEKKRLLDALDGLIDGSSLCHGDFQPDNLILAQKGMMVVDWFDASQGTPAMDVASSAIRIAATMGESAADDSMLPFCRDILTRVRQRQSLAVEDVSIWLPPLAAIVAPKRGMSAVDAARRLLQNFDD